MSCLTLVRAFLYIRNSYGLGEIQPLGWSPGGEYGLLDYDYIPVRAQERDEYGDMSLVAL